MSVQKVHTVKAARKPPGKCGSCSRELGVGDGYLWWTMGFRSSHKYIRCLATACYPRQSERETSKAAGILVAQENFEDRLAGLESVDDVEAAVQEVADAIGEVRDEYREAADAWEYGNTALEEKADHYEAQQSELDGWSYDGADDWELCDDHYDADTDAAEVLTCEACAANRQQWLDELRAAASEAVGAVELA